MNAKFKSFKKKVAWVILAVFLCQNVSWAGTEDKLAPVPHLDEFQHALVQAINAKKETQGSTSGDFGTIEDVEGFLQQFLDDADKLKSAIEVVKSWLVERGSINHFKN